MEALRRKGETGPTKKSYQNSLATRLTVPRVHRVTPLHIFDATGSFPTSSDARRPPATEQQTGGETAALRTSPTGGRHRGRFMNSPKGFPRTRRHRGNSTCSSLTRGYAVRLYSQVWGGVPHVRHRSTNAARKSFQARSPLGGCSQLLESSLGKHSLNTVLDEKEDRGQRV